MSEYIEEPDTIRNELIDNGMLRGGRMSENLRECPFCGGEAKTVKADNPSYTQHSEGWYVMCSCGVSLGYHGNDDQYRTYGDFASELGAAMAWNTRAERTCRDCTYSRKDGTLCMFFAAYAPIAGGDEYAEMPADVEPDGFCAWASRKEVRDE